VSGVSRRSVLKAGAVASAAMAGPVAARSLRKGSLVVFDSSIAESRAFATLAVSARQLDLAREHRTRFATLRAGLPQAGSIEGLTLWSDWVALRSELETQGWRLAFEAATGRRAALYRWTMRRA